MHLVDIAENPVPPNAIVRLVRAGTAELRVARWPADPARQQDCPGTVVICSGRGEFIEKYAEVVHDLVRRGFVVVAFDWCGQGGSSRLLGNRRKGHVDSFDRYQADLKGLHANVLVPHCPRPWFGLGHSMGGAILIDHAGRGSSIFDRIVLSAPMMQIYGLKFPGMVRSMASAAAVLGLGGLFVPGGGSRSAMMQPFDGNVLTSDRRRFAAFAALARAAPELTIGAPTQGWLRAALQVMRTFEDGDYPRRILTPILVVACGQDRVVNTAVTERFATRLKAGRVITVPHARHEILMEQDPMRDQFWAAFDAFIPGSTDMRHVAA